MNILVLLAVLLNSILDISLLLYFCLLLRRSELQRQLIHLYKKNYDELLEILYEYTGKPTLRTPEEIRELWIGKTTTSI